MRRTLEEITNPIYSGNKSLSICIYVKWFVFLDGPSKTGTYIQRFMGILFVKSVRCYLLSGKVW